jgi:hypothetical protein
MNQRLRKSHRWLGHLLAAGWAILLIGSVQAQNFDGLTADSPGNLLSDGGFEGTAPSYWEASGAGATWSAERARTPNYSLALSGAAAAAWEMPEAVLEWVPRFPGNVDLSVGGFVQTEGVNTAPSGDDEKFQLVFNFYNADGDNLLGGELALDLPQEAASTGGWVELNSDALGVLTLPEDATSATIAFRKGASATGSAWLDDLFIRTTSEEWPGDIHNANVDVPGGWYYYWDGFPRGENWPEEQPFVVSRTTAEAHTGSAAGVIEHNFEQGGEAVLISERVPVTEGEPMLVSFWVKTEDVEAPEEIGTGPEKNIGLVALFHEQLESGAAGYGELGGLDVRLNGEFNPRVIPLLPQEASTGWTQYAFVVYPLAFDEREIVGMEVRLRMWREFTGTAYWDDVAITPLGGTTLVTDAEDGPDEALPQTARLQQNYPNPFNRQTTIAFELPQTQRAHLAVYDLLGKRVATLIDDELLTEGSHQVVFDARDLPSGIYFYALQTPEGVRTQKMVLLK